MSMKRFAPVVVCLSMLCCVSSLRAQTEDAAQLWNDFMHYIRVARLDLAASSGQALLELDLAPGELLQVIEQSRFSRNYPSTLLRAQNIKLHVDPEEAERLADVAKQVERAIERAQAAVILEPQRIRDAIERLDDGQRAYMNALRLLREAGEHAAPQFINVLLSREQTDRDLRQDALKAIVEIGRPLVVPLSESLLHLPPVPRQQVAQALGLIGYPAAMPYLKHVAADPQVDTATQQVAEQALQRIAQRSGVSATLSTAELYRQLAGDYYQRQPSLILQPEAEMNLMWQANREGRLSAVPIPTPIFGDVIAMRLSRRALQLQPDLTDALSLWIAANFRRENNLPAGETDPSYSDEMRSPGYYAMLAGPRHVSPVLAWALSDNDAELALDAIRALASTVGDESLGRLDVEHEPLLAALDYPDRRVRFESAFAVARAMPTSSFTGSSRVVPVLASAVRQTGQLTAAVIAPELDAAATAAERLRAAGEMEVLTATSLSDLADQLVNVAAIDLLVLQVPVQQVETIVAGSRENPKLFAAPVIVFATPDELVQVNRIFTDRPDVFVTDTAVGSEQAASLLEQAMQRIQGGAIDEEQALGYALEAIYLLRDLAMTGNEALDPAQAEVALIEALGDGRESISLGASEVLSLLNSNAAQQAIADMALDSGQPEGLRIRYLGDLAYSAKRFGRLLSDRQIDLLLNLVDQARGDLADAAAEAYGALDMPTAHGVELITR